MKKSLFLILSVVAVTISSIAQKVNATWGETIDKPANAPTEVIYADDNYSYILYPGFFNRNTHRRAQNPKLVKFDKNNNEVFTKEIELGNEDIELIKIVPVKDNFIAITKSERKKELSCSVGYTTIDYDGKTVNPNKEIFPIKYSDKKFFTMVEVKTSADKSKIALFLIYFNPVSAYTTLVFDAQMKELYKSEGPEKKKDESDYFRKTDFSVSNHGEVSVLGSIQSTPSLGGAKVITNFGGGIPDYENIAEMVDNPKEYKLYHHNSENRSECTINTSGKYFRNLHLNISKTGETLVAGNFSPERSASIEGVFCAKIGKSDNSVTPNFKPFSEETKNLISKYVNDAGGNFNRAPYRILKSKGFVLSEGGYSYLISEIYYKETSTSSKNVFTPDWQRNSNPGRLPNQQTVLEVTEHFLDNIVTIIAPDGAVENTVIVSKNQARENSKNFGSICFFTNSNNLYLLFNDKEENISAGEDEKTKDFKNWKKTVGMLVAISKEGKISRDILHHNSDLKAIMEPASLLQVNEKLALVTAIPIIYADQSLISNSHYSLGRIEIGEQ